MKVIFKLIITLTLFSNSHIYSQNFWEHTSGPGGGYIYSMDVNNKGDIFIATCFGGVFRSEDNGNSWTQINEGITNKNVLAVEVNSDEKIIAGTTEGGVYVSTNNGDNWISKKIESTSYNINAVIINSDGYIFAGNSEGIFRSTNNGDNWLKINTGLLYTNILSFAVNASGYIFAGTNGGLYSTSNNGELWVLKNNGLPNSTVENIVVSPNGDIYIGTLENGVYKSIDNGESWIQINTGLVNTSILSLIYTGSGELLAGTHNGGIFLSTNNGNTWTPKNYGLINTDVKTLSFNSQGYLFAGTEGGVYRSMNNGTEWLQINYGLVNNTVRALVKNASGVIYAGCDKTGIYRSNDNGNRWIQINNGLAITDIYALCVHSNGYLFAGTYEGIFRSTNNGENWTKVNEGSSSDLNNIIVQSIIVNSNGNIFAGTYGGGVYRSTDNGDIWTQSNNGIFYSNIMSLAVTSNNTLFAATNGGLFKSTDNGDNWVQVSNGINDNYILSVKVNSNNQIFAGTYNAGVYLSTDNGENWILKGLENLKATSFAFNSKGHVFAASAHGGGVYRSTDNGNHWNKLSAGLSDDFNYSLLINSNGYLFSGTSSNGVFRSIYSTTPNLPNVPILINPGNNAIKQSIPLTFSWNTVENAESYKLQVSKDQDFSLLEVNDSLIYLSSKDGIDLNDGTKYYWRVCSKNVTGSSPFSVVRSFSTALITPDKLNAVIFQANSVKLNWTDKSQNELGFIIERKLETAGSFQVIDTAIANITTYDDINCESGKTYYYRIKAFNTIESSNYSNEVSADLSTDVDDNKIHIKESLLCQNYPNPFNPATMIKYQISEQCLVKLVIYDQIGRELIQLVNKEQNPGIYHVSFTADRFPSGIYYYKLSAGNYISVKKMIVLK